MKKPTVNNGHIKKTIAKKSASKNKKTKKIEKNFDDDIEEIEDLNLPEHNPFLDINPDLTYDDF